MPNESRIEMDGNRPYLVCYYDIDRCNYGETIEAAKLRHKVTEPMPVLCLPIKKALEHEKR